MSLAFIYFYLWMQNATICLFAPSWLPYWVYHWHWPIIQSSNKRAVDRKFLIWTTTS